MAGKKKKEPEPEATTPPTPQEETTRQNPGDIDNDVYEPIQQAKPRIPAQQNDQFYNHIISQVKFLKQYAVDPSQDYTSLAKAMNVNYQDAERYVKKYIYLVVNTQHDPDFPRKAKAILNQNVPVQYQITDHDILQLKPLVEKYGDYEVVQDIKSDVPYIGDNTAMNPNLGKQELNVPQINSNEPLDNRITAPYANLPRSPRADLLKWILDRAPYVHYTRVDPCVELFQANEINFMKNPEEMFSFLTRYFGDTPGKLIFDQFKSMIGFLPPGQGFGANLYSYPPGAGQGNFFPNGGGQTSGFQSWGPQGGGYGNQYGQMPQSSYHSAIGVIPPGVDPQSPLALRFIQDYEDERRRKRSSEEMNEKITQMVQLQMMDAFNVNKKQNGGSNNSDEFNKMMMIGMKPEPIQNPDGSISYRWTAPEKGQDTQLEYIKLMMNTYQTVLQSQTQQPKFLESILNTLLGRFNTSTDPFQAALDAKKLADAFNPPQSQALSLQAADLALKRDRLSLDKDMAMMTMKQNHEQQQWERTQQARQEEESAKNTGEIMKSIFSVGKEWVLPMAQIFLGNRMGGAGGNMAGVAGGMMQGMQGGMPPQQQQQQEIPPYQRPPIMQPPGEPDWQEIAARQQGNAATQFDPRFAAQPSTMFGNNAITPEQAQYYEAIRQQQQQQQYQQQQPVYPQPQQNIPTQTAASQPRVFTPEEFETMSDAEIAEYEKQGQQSELEMRSFKNAIYEAKRRKANRYPPPPQQQTAAANIPTSNQVFAQPQRAPIEQELPPGYQQYTPNTTNELVYGETSTPGEVEVIEQQEDIMPEETNTNTQAGYEVIEEEQITRRTATMPPQQTTPDTSAPTFGIPASDRPRAITEEEDNNTPRQQVVTTSMDLSPAKPRQSNNDIG